MWLECGSYVTLPRLCGYSTTGLPCVYHDVWLERGSYVALPRLWLECDNYVVDPRL